MAKRESQLTTLPSKEVPMAVEVIIRRTFKKPELAEKLVPLIVQLRSQATVQKGYITGQTLRCIDCPGEYLVISTWHTEADWQRWFASSARQALQQKIDELLGEPTQYRLYEPLVGGIIPDFALRSTPLEAP
jgi:heme-degrading monooxygenase HmoA